MKIRFLLILAMIIGFSALLFLFLFEESSEPEISEGREDLKDVYHSNNFRSKTYRGELSAMMSDKEYDYKNDTIFQECFKVMDLERNSGTVYSPNQKQAETIREYCRDVRDLTDTKGLSYSNHTHYINTVTCEWMEFKGNEKPRPDLLP